jgi:hypothetical protein
MRCVLAILIRFLAAVELLAVLIALVQPAYAYVDPGAGLFAFQIVASTFAGMIFIVRRRLRILLQKMTLHTGSRPEKAAK